jgi:hypothetical protein
MPYTNAWNVTDPPGTEQARNIDDHIRKLRLDLEERFESSLVVDMSADPLVLRDEVLGKQDGKQIIINFDEFAIDTGSSVDYIPASGYLEAGAPMTAAIKLMAGVTITKVELLCDRLAAGVFAWRVYSRAFSGVAPTEVTLVNHAGAGVTVSDTGDVEWLIGAGEIYYVYVGSTIDNKRIYGARVTFNTPNSRFTY